MVIAEISIVPLGTGSPSVSQYVAKAIQTLDQESNIQYKLTGMGTILEGTWTSVLEAVKKMHDSVFDDKIQRVVTTIRIDDRRDRESSVKRKIQSVAKRLK